MPLTAAPGYAKKVTGFTISTSDGCRVTRNHANDSPPRNKPSADRISPNEPISNRYSKLLEIELTYTQQSTSLFLIDNFRVLFPRQYYPRKSSSLSLTRLPQKH